MNSTPHLHCAGPHRVRCTHSSQHILNNETKRQPPVPSISALNVPQPTIQKTGDRGSQNSPCESDEEFFLDEFNEAKLVKRSRHLHQLGDDSDTIFQTIPSHFETFSDQTGSKLWTLDDSDGEEGSFSERLSTSKKRPRPTESVENQEEGSQRWDLPEFMNSSRSASQQGAIELGVQMSWGLKFAAGRVHSMIRYSEQSEPADEDRADRYIVSVEDEGNTSEPTHAELANKFLACNAGNSAGRLDFMIPTSDRADSTSVDLTNRVKISAGNRDNSTEPTYADLANRFVASMGSRSNINDVRAAVNLTSTGRPYCSHSGCTKQAQAKGLCIAHGGVKECIHPGCRAISRWRGFCAAHGGRRTCSVEGCEKLSRSQRKCEGHGGGGYTKCSFPSCTTKAIRKGLCATHGGSLMCNIEGCERKALTKGLCGSHGGGTRCKIEGCGKITSAGGFCHHHAIENGVPIKTKGKCTVEGCVKFRLYAGYCTKHAKERGFAVGRKCQTEGCEKSAQAGGHCISHGGGARCTRPGCSKQAYSKGLCGAHGGRITCKVKGCEKWGLMKGHMKGYCVEHGGGIRCKHSGCTRSVQYKGLCYTHGGWATCEYKGCKKRVKWKGFCRNHKATTSVPIHKK